MAVLLIEDESGITSFVRRGLEAAGYSVLVANNGLDGADIALMGDIELVVLDLGLPGLPGKEVLKRIRQRRPALPVVVLTAQDTVDDRVALLEAGADDYMVKPFSFSELLARIRARLRLAGQERTDIITVGDLEINVVTRTIVVADRPMTLSAREFALLETLVRHSGQVLSQAQLLDRVWGYDFEGSSNVVEVFVSQLRRKIGRQRIETVRGAGYRLVEV